MAGCRVVEISGREIDYEIEGVAREPGTRIAARSRIELTSSQRGRVGLVKWAGRIGERRLAGADCIRRRRGGEANDSQPSAGTNEKEGGENAGIKTTGLGEGFF